MGLDLSIVAHWSFGVKERRDLDEFVYLERGGLNRTPGEAIDLAEMLTEPRNGSATWIARLRSDETIIGFVALHRGATTASRHTASLRIHVGAGRRDLGVGEALISRALGWADSDGVERITATPYERGGLGLYSSIFERHGFEREGVMRDAVRVGDGYRNMALLARVRTPIARR